METTRIRIRAMEPEDLEDLYAIENDFSVWELGITNVPYSKYLIHDYIANANGDIYHDGQVRMIIENGQHEVVGIIDLMDFSPAHKRAEIGIVIKKEHRQKGYATEALYLVSHYARRILHLHQLYAVIGCHNEEALRLFSSNGYKVQNRLKEWLYDGEKYHDAQIMQLFL